MALEGFRKFICGTNNEIPQYASMYLLEVFFLPLLSAPSYRPNMDMYMYVTNLIKLLKHVITRALLEEFWRMGVPDHHFPANAAHK